jgi:hypothetical protein
VVLGDQEQYNGPASQKWVEDEDDTAYYIAGIEVPPPPPGPGPRPPARRRPSGL